jgi:hypothetical protein
MSNASPQKEEDYDPEVQTKHTSDEAIMAKLGYKQELKRDLTLLQVSLPVSIGLSTLTEFLAELWVRPAASSDFQFSSNTLLQRIVLDHFHYHWNSISLSLWIEHGWTGSNGMGMDYSLRLHPMRWCGYGGDLLLPSNIRWSLLLVRKAFHAKPGKHVTVAVGQSDLTKTYPRHPWPAGSRAGLISSGELLFGLLHESNLTAVLDK